MAKKKDLFRNLNKGTIKQDKKIIRTQGIKQNIQILPELKSLIPPLREEEHRALEENIIAQGCRDALLVWEHGEEYILIDGHNRFGICQKHNIDFNIKLLEFDDIAQVRAYMIDNQLGRRNLTPEQASYLRGMKYNQQKTEKGKYDRQKYKGQNVPYGSDGKIANTSEKLASEFKVSEKTVKRDALYAEGLEKIGASNQDLKRDILAGVIKVKKGDIQRLAKVQSTKKIVSTADIENLLQEPDKTDLKTKSKKPLTQNPHHPQIQKILELGQQLLKDEKDLPTLCDQIITEATTLKDVVHQQASKE